MSSLKPEEDYLDEDKPFRHTIKKQNFCIISMLTPNSFPETRRDEFKDQKILGVKVRGVFETYEDAKIQAEKLQKQDKYHNIFVGEVGKWLPFNVDIGSMETEEEPVYREQALNQYMKAYKDCLKEEEVTEKIRKEESLKGANVVTGKSGAPDYTGIGNPEITPPGTIPRAASFCEKEELGINEESEIEKINEYKNIESSNIDEQIKSTNNEKNKIVTDLEESKNNLKELESKLAQINSIYAELKK